MQGELGSHDEGHGDHHEGGKIDVILGEAGVGKEFIGCGENEAAAQADPTAIPASRDPGREKNDQRSGESRGKADDPDGIAVLSEDGGDGYGGPLGEWGSLEPGAATAARDDPVVGLHHLPGKLGQSALVKREGAAAEHRVAKEQETEQREEGEVEAIEAPWSGGIGRGGRRGSR